MPSTAASGETGAAGEVVAAGAGTEAGEAAESVGVTLGSPAGTKKNHTLNLLMATMISNQRNGVATYFIIILIRDLTSAKAKLK